MPEMSHSLNMIKSQGLLSVDITSQKSSFLRKTTREWSLRTYDSKAHDLSMERLETKNTSIVYDTQESKLLWKAHSQSMWTAQSGWR